MGGDDKPPQFALLRPDVPKVSTWDFLLERSYSERRYSNGGPLFELARKRLTATYCSPGYSAIPVSSATAGLVAALKVQLNPGSGVVVPTFSFPATLHAVLMAGGIPIVADVSMETWALDDVAFLDAMRFAQENGLHVEGVMPVRPFGSLLDFERLSHAAEALDSWIVTDSAAALPSPLSGYRFGSDFGGIEVISLHATKAAGIGEGGIVFVPDHLADRFASSINFGVRPDPLEFGDGTNAKLDEFGCARILALLKDLPETMSRRAELAQLYAETLSDFPFVEPSPFTSKAQPWSLFPILLPSRASRDSLAVNLKSLGVATRVYYSPLLGKGYQGRSRLLRMSTPNAESLVDRILCLPMRADLEHPQRQDLLFRLRRALDEAVDRGETP